MVGTTPNPESSSVDVSTHATPTIEPTERSIPPEMMTIVIPTEMMPVTATCFKMLNTFSVA